MTLCNVPLRFEIEKGKTILYTDGTLVINELSENHAANETEHGAVYKEYPGGPYTFASDWDIPWYANASRVRRVEIGSNMKPTSLARWFTGLENCRSMDLTKLDTSNVTDMTRTFAFTGALSMKTIDLSGFDTGKVTSFAGMFRRCQQITSLDVSGFDVSKATDFSEMFSGCGDLTMLDLSSWQNNIGTSFDRMFAQANELVAIYATDAFEVKQTADTSQMFDGCSVLAGSMGTQYDAAIIDGRRALVDGKDGKQGYFSDKTVGTSILYQDGTLVINERPADRTANITAHGQVMRQWGAVNDANSWTAGWAKASGEAADTRIKKAVLGQPLKPKRMEGWFSGLGAMTEFDTTGLDTSDCTTMRLLFYRCQALTSCDMGSWNTSKVTDMSSMFHSAKAFVALANYVNGFDTSNVTDLSGWVLGVDLVTFAPKINTTKVKRFSSTFAYMQQLTKLDVSALDTAAAEDCPFMFGMNPELTTIVASDKFVLQAGSESSNMFRNDYKLVGGAGTAYDASHITGEYARFDNPPSAPGYFQEKGPQAKWASFNSATGLLRIFEDDANAWTDGQTDGTTTYWTGVETKYQPPWSMVASQIQKISIETTIKRGMWPEFFAYTSNLQQITGLEKLNVSGASYFYAMFKGCGLSGTLDLSMLRFDSYSEIDYVFQNMQNIEEIRLPGISGVTCSNTFSGCASLRTIKVGSGWSCDPDYIQTFSGCVNLVGGAGTPYDPAQTNSLYARIDNPPDAPGYLTAI